MGGALTLAVALFLELTGVVLIVVFVAVVIRSRRGRVSPGPDPDGVLRWEAHLFMPSRQLSPSAQWNSARYGWLELAPSELRWHGSTGEFWRTPVSAVSLRSVHGFRFMAGDPSVDVDIDGAGSWRIVVSDRSINRFLRNDLKRASQARIARDLAAALLSRGARDLTRGG